ncbi:VOC family protein [Rhizobium halophytocola]|uniref:VOC family protein n=1 Tax=Rhizobium halophytocola TaxID=735519 RepID=UPI001AE7D3FF
MQQQISVVTLGTADMARSHRFYSEGFGWETVFENEFIHFYQMNGMVLGLFRNDMMLEDSGRAAFNPSGAFALGHNVAKAEDVAPLMERLVAAGGRIIQPAAAPPHGGMRGYVTDPDDNAWEIAWNPAWTIDEHGHVTFGV